MPGLCAAVRKATEADAQQPPQHDSVGGAQVHRAAAPAPARDATSQTLLETSATVRNPESGSTIP